MHAKRIALLCLSLTVAALPSGVSNGADAPHLGKITPLQSVLSVPASVRSLQVSARWPGATDLDASRSWALTEIGGNGESIPVEIVSAIAPDGKPAPERMLLASIPPRASARAERRFRIERSAGPSSDAGVRFRFADESEKALGLWEGKRPVLVYNHGVQSKPGVPADRNRSTYVHPIYGLDGEVLTDDFPKDHYHHRGLFWAWPHVTIEGQQYDLWDIRRIHQRFERWLGRQAGAAAAVLGIENGWYTAEKKVMQERVWLTVYPASNDAQALDVDLTWMPIDKPVTLEGAPAKSYGGLTLRFAPRTETVITTPFGNKPEDLAVTRLPWADFSARFAGAPKPSGAAIFISPDHPDYPPTWLTRHYGVLCVGWPGVTPATFQPGEIIHCRYRVWIHRGTPDAAHLEQAYRDYLASQKTRVVMETARPAADSR